MQKHSTTHPEAIIPSHKLTAVSEPSELADAVEGVSEQTAENIFYLVRTRAENRESGRTDIVVAFEEWAYADWSDIDVAPSPIVLAGRVEDHSEDAWFARGAFYIQWDAVADRPREAVEDEWMNDLLGQIDETDKDFIDRLASTYWPKSSISDFFTIEQ